MLEGIGAAILTFLAQYAATGALDRTVGERIDRFLRYREKRDHFDRSVERVLRLIETRFQGHANVFRDGTFLKNHAIIELAKFFSVKDRPSVDGLVACWRDYRSHLPSEAPAIAKFFLEEIETALIEHAEFRELIHFKRSAEDSERLRRIEERQARLVRPCEAPQPVVHLPADIADFQGREKEIAALLRSLRGLGQGAVIAIGGMGGIGKSALAVHVAHQLVDAATDGRVFVDMGGTSPNPLKPVDAMIKVVRALEPGRQVPTEEEGAAAAYQSVLQGRRVLLVLDNAESTAQVQPLVTWRARTTLVLVTSRRTITGVERVDLQAMAPDEARTLMRSAFGRRPAADDVLHDIVERCGRLPLALRVAGTFLKEAPEWSIEAYLEALADQKRRLEIMKIDDPKLDVFAVLALSAERLAAEKPDLAARWQLLSIFPSSFDLAAATAVWEIETDAARAALGDLRRRSMVIYDEADQRWRLHELLRDAATLPICDEAQSALEVRFDAACLRHARHYCALLAHATRCYKQGQDGVLIGLALYDREERNIVAGQAWASARIEKDSSVAQLAGGFADAGYMILPLRLEPRVWFSWLEVQRDACERLGDRWGEADALGNMGAASYLLGEPRQAIEVLEQALTVFRAVGDKRREGAALGNLGTAWLDLSYPRRAIKHHQQALSISRDIGDRMAESQDLANLGMAFRLLGKPLRAIEFLGPALEIARKIGDRLNEGKALGLLGSAWVDLGEPRRAIEMFREWLAIAREIGDLMSEGNALFNLGSTMHELGEREQAFRRVHEALAIYKQIGAKHFLEDARKRLAAWGANCT